MEKDFRKRNELKMDGADIDGVIPKALDEDVAKGWGEMVD